MSKILDVCKSVGLRLLCSLLECIVNYLHEKKGVVNVSISVTVRQLQAAMEYIETHDYISSDTLRIYQPTEVDEPLLFTRV